MKVAEEKKEATPTERQPIRPELAPLYEYAYGIAQRSADFKLPPDVAAGISGLHEMIGDLAYGPRADETKRATQRRDRTSVDAAPTRERLTFLEIDYVCKPGVATRWFVRRSDGGPLDGAGDDFDTDEDLAKFLIGFLTRREGRVSIVRNPHPYFDRMQFEIERIREAHATTERAASPTDDWIQF